MIRPRFVTVICFVFLLVRCGSFTPENTSAKHSCLSSYRTKVDQAAGVGVGLSKALRAIYADDLEKGSIVRMIYFLLTSILKRAASSV